MSFDFGPAWVMFTIIAIGFYVFFCINKKSKLLLGLGTVLSTSAALFFGLQWQLGAVSEDAVTQMASFMAAFFSMIFAVFLLFSLLVDLIDWQIKERNKELTQELMTALVPVIETEVAKAVLADRAKKTDTTEGEGQ